MRMVRDFKKTKTHTENNAQTRQAKQIEWDNRKIMEFVADGGGLKPEIDRKRIEVTGLVIELD